MADIGLLQKQDFLKLVLNNIPSYVFWKDRDGTYLGCNENFAKSAGLNDPNEIIGKNDYDLSWSKEDSDFYRATDKRIMDAGKEELNFEEPQTLPDGKTLWLRTSKIPLYNDHNEVVGILGTYEDITERKEMELALIEQTKTLTSTNEDLKKSNFELEQAHIDLEQFAYATSHDLQEPLRIIGGFTTLINNKYTDVLDEKGKEYLKYVSTNVEKLSLLLRSVFTYSNANSNNNEFELVDFQELLLEQEKALQPLIEKHNARIQYNLTNEKVLCQPNRISILLHNLITNGIKFNTSETPIINIDFEEKETEWLFSVKDNGIGVCSTCTEKIFKPFTRLNPKDEFEGNGIGLSISKRIVHIHQGKIWYKTIENQGSTFYFTISKNLTK